jgi:Flp pilus assembly protein CpaB
VFLTLAALAGSVAFWVGSSESRAVVIATHDLAAGTAVTAADLAVAYVRLDDALYNAALPADMLGSVVGRQLGEPIHAQQVLARAQVASRLELAVDQVAITIPARPDTAVDGRLRAGDTVEVLFTAVDKARNEAHARVLLEHASVLEVGREQAYTSVAAVTSIGADGDGSAGAITSVTLATTPDQARQLAEARRAGELDVLLLPPPELAHP